MPSAPTLRSYHCAACSALVLLSALPLSSLLARSGTQDQSRILPPTTPVFPAQSQNPAAPEPAPAEALPLEWRKTLSDRAARAVRVGGPDSTWVELRYPRRCRRCLCVVGYTLRMQGGTELLGEGEGGGQSGQSGQSGGEGAGVECVLEEGLVETEDLKKRADVQD